MPPNFLIRILNAVLPPRETERAVEALALDTLFALRAAEGLPYSDEGVRALVWELKYHASRRAAALAGALLAEELLAIASEELGRPLLVPVPIHKARRRERGHNQTELLCEAALRHVGGAYDYLPHALVRARNTPHQQGLPRSRRLGNVRGSMEASDPSAIKGRACVVIDDVATTGATLAEATRALKAAGAARVYTLALARS